MNKTKCLPDKLLSDLLHQLDMVWKKATCKETSPWKRHLPYKNNMAYESKILAGNMSSLMCLNSEQIDVTSMICRIIYLMVVTWNEAPTSNSFITTSYNWPPGVRVVGNKSNCMRCAYNALLISNVNMETNQLVWTTRYSKQKHIWKYNVCISTKQHITYSEKIEKAKAEPQMPRWHGMCDYNSWG